MAQVVPCARPPFPIGTSDATLARMTRNTTRFRLGLLATLAPLLPLGCSDTVTSTDAAIDAGSTADQGFPVDQGFPIDRGNPVDVQVAVDRGNPADVQIAVDRQDPVDLGTPVDRPTVVDAGTPVDGPAPADAGRTCPTRESRQCLTLEEVEARIRSAPGGGDALRPIPIDGGARDAALAPIDASREGNGCYSPQHVQSGCCNPATSVEREGELCCYTWCDMACCGRPMMVDGAPRAAEMVPASSWVASPSDLVAGLDAATRSALASAWREDGRMEHASVASFARFTMELLAMGAPPELLADAQRAALDEVDHARLCLDLAATLDGATAGPGALDPSGALDGLSAEKSVRDAIVEGCVGETVAALVAQAQLARATHPQARAVLERIAADEERHAALAWRFVAWAMTARPELRPVVERTFADALLRPVPVLAEVAVDAPAWRAWGRLSQAEHAVAVAEALGEVIGPCVRSLMAGSLRSTDLAASRSPTVGQARAEA